MGSRRVVQSAALLLVLWVTCVHGQGNRNSFNKGQLQINQQLGEIYEKNEIIFWKTVPNGTIIKHGTKMRLRCTHDYELFGGGLFLYPDWFYRTKNNGGAWDPELAVCKPKRCDVPDTYHRADSYDDESVAQGKLLHGSNVTMVCDEGYEIKPGQTVEVNTCKKGHLPVPRCSEKPCLRPKVENACNIEANNRIEHSKSITIECKSGYELPGGFPTIELTCQFGNFEPERGTNIPKECNETRCDLSELDDHDYMPLNDEYGDSLRTMASGDTLTATCRNGYHLQDNDTEVQVDIRCEKGTLYYDIPCQPIECMMPNVTAMIRVAMVKQSYKPREEIRGLTCAAGEELVGDSNLFCQDDGAWRGTAACTTLVECMVPNVTALIPGQMVKQSYKPREEIRGLTCAAGEELVGNSSLVCQDDGTWHGTAACKPRDCGAPPAIQNADVSAGGTLEGDTSNYTCSQGYVLRNAVTLDTTCQHNSAWSTPSFNCLRDCYEPPAIANATLSAGDTLEGSRRTYTCITESIVIATPVSTVCQPNGTWTTVDLKCYTGECPPEWQQIGSSCYIVVNPGIWIQIDNSLRFCQNTYPAYKTYMFQLETAEEDDAVVSNVIKNIKNNARFCLGLHDAHRNSTWMWMATNEPLTYSNWYRGEPDGPPEYYVRVLSGYNYQWWDVYDSHPCQPLCEISLL